MPFRRWITQSCRSLLLVNAAMLYPGISGMSNGLYKQQPVFGAQDLFFPTTFWLQVRGIILLGARSVMDHRAPSLATDLFWWGGSSDAFDAKHPNPGVHVNIALCVSPKNNWIPLFFCRVWKWMTLRDCWHTPHAPESLVGDHCANPFEGRISALWKAKKKRIVNASNCACHACGWNHTCSGDPIEQNMLRDFAYSSPGSTNIRWGEISI